MLREFGEGNAVEFSEGGDIIKIHGGSAKMALEIAKILEPGSASGLTEQEEGWIETVNTPGEVLRPGVWAIYLSGGDLIVQNVNGRGDEDYNNQMKVAVSKVTGLNL